MEHMCIMAYPMSELRLCISYLTRQEAEKGTKVVCNTTGSIGYPPTTLDSKSTSVLA